uniref:FAD-dependent oxidoreductase domain-containing protein 1 n=1 Tax=Knipowitschia caucasica TaxID=637954 RepID=A0AAV2J625_KNICA
MILRVHAGARAAARVLSRGPGPGPGQGLGRKGWTVLTVGDLCRCLCTSAVLRKDIIKDLEERLSSIKQTALDALPGSSWSPLQINPNLPPERADIVVVGGGIVGWSVAYWLKQKERVRGEVRVLVVEKDPTYSQASTVLSAGGIRQQFSLAENILLSLHSADFMRNINDHLGVLNEEPVDLQFNQSGYLFLANEDVAHIMEENYKTQRYAGAKVSLLSPSQVKEKFPWINTEGVALASYGLENEGWFDPWTLLSAFRRKAISLGVIPCSGEVTGFQYNTSSLTNQDGDLVTLRRIRSVKWFAVSVASWLAVDSLRAVSWGSHCG